MMLPGTELMGPGSKLYLKIPWLSFVQGKVESSERLGRKALLSLLLRTQLYIVSHLMHVTLPLCFFTHTPHIYFFTYKFSTSLATNIYTVDRAYTQGVQHTSLAIVTILPYVGQQCNAQVPSPTTPSPVPVSPPWPRDHCSTGTMTCVHFTHHHRRQMALLSCMKYTTKSITHTNCLSGLHSIRPSGLLAPLPPKSLLTLLPLFVPSLFLFQSPCRHACKQTYLELSTSELRGSWEQ